MKDVAGNEIAGYRYGPYYFPVVKGTRISALCGQYYNSEAALVAAFDSAHGSHPESPELIRVYAEGAEFKIRPRRI